VLWIGKITAVPGIYLGWFLSVILNLKDKLNCERNSSLGA
jgi:hypothetical protein